MRRMGRILAGERLGASCLTSLAAPTAKGEELPEGVELTVNAPKVGTPFTIDGVKAGKTPQSIKIKGRTRPIEIRGNNVIKIVTPDRDQVVNLAP